MMHPGSKTPSRRAIVAGRIGALAATIALAATVIGCDERDRLSNRMALALNDPVESHPIGFSSRTEALLVQLPPRGEGLSNNQYADVYRFVKRFGAESNGALTIATPGGGWRDGVASSRVIDDIRQALREGEIDERLVKRVASAKGSPGSVRLSYLRPIAIAPECGIWNRDVGYEPERVPYPQYGCATQRNLAGMVANARDLQRPQDEDPASSERRSALWSKYVPPSGVAAADDTTKAKAPATTNK
jgi:pilus assembly protein CpaD